MSFWTDLLGLQFEVRNVDVKGVGTRVMTLGEGEPLICLHGISGHLEAFLATAPEHAKDFSVHLIDMLGHGYTDKPEGLYTIDRLAQHVIDYMDVAGIEQANFCGISLGGWVVGWLAAYFPHRVKRVTMVLAAGNPAMANPDITERIRATIIAAVSNQDIEDTRKRLEMVVHNPKRVTRELVEARYAIYHQPAFQAAVDQVLAPTRSDLYQRFMLTDAVLGLIKAQVLLVWSDKDVYSDVTGAQHFVDHLPQQKLVTFESTGDWPPHERPLAFASLNVDFLKHGLEAVRSGNFDHRLEEAP